MTRVINEKAMLARMVKESEEKAKLYQEIWDKIKSGKFTKEDFEKYSKKVDRLDILYMLYKYGYSYQEIAERTGYTRYSAKTLVAKAKKKIEGERWEEEKRRKQLEEYERKLIEEDLEPIDVKKIDLDRILKSLVRKTRGAIEYILSDLMVQAIHSSDQLVKISKIGEMLLLLPKEVKEDPDYFKPEELRRARLISSMANALLNADINGGRVRVGVSLEYEEFKEIMEPILRKKGILMFIYQLPRDVSVESRRMNETIRKMEKEDFVEAFRHALYVNITYHAYLALRNIFVDIYLPYMMELMERVAELIQPSSLTAVMRISLPGERRGGKMAKSTRTDYI